MFLDAELLQRDRVNVQFDFPLGSACAGKSAAFDSSKRVSARFSAATSAARRSDGIVCSCFKPGTPLRDAYFRFSLRRRTIFGMRLSFN
jgi:hypothetical protein